MNEIEDKIRFWRHLFPKGGNNITFINKIYEFSEMGGLNVTFCVKLNEISTYFRLQVPSDTFLHINM